MRADEIRDLSDADLASRLADLERERFHLRFKSGTQPLEDPLLLRTLRHEVARVKTIQRERALGIVRVAAGKVAPAKKKAKKTAKSATRGTTRRAGR